MAWTVENKDEEEVEIPSAKGTGAVGDAHAGVAGAMAKHDEIQEHIGMAQGLKEITIDAVNMPFEPVAGGMVWRILYVITVLLVIIFFIVSLAAAAGKKWKDPVVSVEFVRETELAYPDVYFCLPAKYAYTYRRNKVDTPLDPIRDMYIASGIKEDGVVGALIRTSCGDASMPVKVDVSSDQLMGQVTGIPSDTCPYQTATMSASATGLKANIGCINLGTDCTGPPTANEVDPLINAKATALTNALSTYTEPLTGTVYKPVCLVYAAKPGAVQRESESAAYKSFVQISVDKFDDRDPFFEAYLVAPGADPVVNGVVTGTLVLFSGFGVTSAAQMQLERVKDETKGETEFTPTWKYNLWTKNMYTNTEQINFQRGLIGWFYDSFTVQQTTIRDVTFTEIYSDIGGFWAASLAILLLFWSKSGFIDSKRGKEAYIFKCLPHMMKRKMIRGMKVKEDPEEA